MGLEIFENYIGKQMTINVHKAALCGAMAGLDCLQSPFLPQFHLQFCEDSEAGIHVQLWGANEMLL